jgi:2-oxo-3-hexenedioate decarboxylase
VASLAERLAAAERDGIAIPQSGAGLTVADAYAAQSALRDARLARGERLTGVKLGFTSLAKMEQMGIDEVIVGFLTDAHRVPSGGELSAAGMVHPRVEPEVAFRVARDVDPVAPDADLAEAVDAVAPALEIIDSRYRDFRFSLPDVIADNTSAARYAVGPWTALRGPGDAAALGDLAVDLEVDGRIAESGSTAAILGHPIEALRRLTGLAARYGHPLTAGTIVLAGAATSAVPLPAAGTVTARVAGLGSVTVTVTGRNR